MQILFLQHSDLIGNGKETDGSLDADISHVYMYYPNENEQLITSGSAGASGMSVAAANRPRTARSKGGGGSRPKSSRPRSKR